MSIDKLPNDNTAAAKGTIYQLCVAVQKCYELLEGQKLLVECLGDVTIANSQQVETKHFEDSLTDNHINFWKTLHNWMRDEFDAAWYTALILWTTQQFGERATIAGWNRANTQRRLDILKEIKQESESRESQRQKKATGSKTPDVLLLQKSILDPSKQPKLLQVVDKFYIEACSPNLPVLHRLIKERDISRVRG